MQHPANRKISSTGVVGVIASPADLARARHLRRPPDFFELRLDALRRWPGEIQRALPRLRAPLILTARHPAEGGKGQLGPSARRRLLERFLDYATLVDLELQFVRQTQPLVAELRLRQIGVILSYHDLRSTPAPDELLRLVKKAAEFDPVFIKVATRTDTPAQLDRLMSFFGRARESFPLAAMGIGKLGRESRRALDRLGSALSYVSLGEPNARGQRSLAQLRRARRA